MKRLVAILLIATSLLAASAQRLWRGRQKMTPETSVVKPRQMRAADSTVVSTSGFEKTLSSRFESLFLTNHSSDTINRVYLHIEYLDAADRQLHSRGEYIGLELPPKSTRRVEIRSFDRQGAMYYHLSTRPRTRANATPFKVRLRVDSVN